MKSQFAHQTLGSGLAAGTALFVVACAGLASLPLQERVSTQEVEAPAIVVQNKTESEDLSVMLFLHRSGIGFLPVAGVGQ